MNTDEMNRAADLHYAFQFGQAAASGDTTAQPEFNTKFADDVEAKVKFDRGYSHYQARNGASN